MASPRAAIQSRNLAVSPKMPIFTRVLNCSKLFAGCGWRGMNRSGFEGRVSGAFGGLQRNEQRHSRAQHQLVRNRFCVDKVVLVKKLSSGFEEKGFTK
jgi:hypothetical protein